MKNIIILLLIIFSFSAAWGQKKDKTLSKPAGVYKVRKADIITIKTLKSLISNKVIMGYGISNKPEPSMAMMTAKNYADAMLSKQLSLLRFVYDNSQEGVNLLEVKNSVTLKGVKHNLTTLKDGSNMAIAYTKQTPILDINKNSIIMNIEMTGYFNPNDNRSYTMFIEKGFIKIYDVMIDKIKTNKGIKKAIINGTVQFAGLELKGFDSQKIVTYKALMVVNIEP